MGPSWYLLVSTWRRESGDHHSNLCPGKVEPQLLTVLVSAFNIRTHRLIIFIPLPAKCRKQVTARCGTQLGQETPNPDCSDANRPAQDTPLSLTELSLEAAEEEKSRISLVPPEERW